MTSPAIAAPVRRQTVPQDYVELKRLVKEAGLLEAKPWYYRVKTVLALGTLAASVVIALIAPNPWILMLDAVFMGFAFTQVALLAHDVGHRQGYRGRIANQVGRYFFGNLVLAVSATWWNDKHNQHHATPNHIDKDPDIQFPMIVFSSEQISSRAKWLRPVISIQAFVLIFLLPFQALNMRYISATHLRSPKAKMPWMQGSLIATHLVLYGVLLYFIGWPSALLFAVIQQGTFGLYNSSVFASNHKGMPLTHDGDERDFLREQVLTSRNVKGHPLTDFWYGGLNYQIEHHLFPTMPRCNLRKSQPLIREFCESRGIPFHTTGLFESYKEVLTSLHRESASLRGGGAPVQA